MTSHYIDTGSSPPRFAGTRCVVVPEGELSFVRSHFVVDTRTQLVSIAPTPAANGAFPEARVEGEVDDKALLYAWRSGDRTAGSTLLKRHTPALQRYFQRRVPHEAADLVQQTLLASVEARDKANEGVPFRAYLFGIARNVLLLYLRRHEVRRRKASLVVDEATRSQSPTDELISRESNVRLLQELGRLPFDLQRTTKMFYWGEYKLNDIAAALAVPSGTVKSRMHAAKKTLRTRLAALG